MRILIIEALNEHYKRLINNPNSGISPPHYSRVAVSHEVVLNKDGEIVGIVDLRVQVKTKLVSKSIDVPEQPKRSSNVCPCFLCGNSAYVFGIEPDKGESKTTSNKIEKREIKCFESFKEFNQRLLKSVDDDGAKAVVNFLNKWSPKVADENEIIQHYKEDIRKATGIVFRLQDDDIFIHQRKKIENAWFKYKSENLSDKIGQCSVTGENTRIAKLHQNIKGVVGGKSTGCALVSYNAPAFMSYGAKENEDNATVSEEVAFAYTTALNYLLKTGKNSIVLGDLTVVFWAEKQTGEEETLLSELFCFNSVVQEEEKRKKSKQNEHEIIVDNETTILIRDILKAAKKGMPITAINNGIDYKSKFYVLGIMPNAARLSVRFWYSNTFGSIIETIAKHHFDMELVKEKYDEEYIPVWKILKEIAPLGDTKKISTSLKDNLMQSILFGKPYPKEVYTEVLARSKNGDLNYIRASVIKAYLSREFRLRKKSEEVITVELNNKSNNVAYNLGRLFAVLERVQIISANFSINRTIKDRYFGAASTSPALVFPRLIQSYQNHLGKLDYEKKFEELIGEITSEIDKFPARLNLEEQGLFMIGFYHQKNALNKKNDKEEGAVVNE